MRSRAATKCISLVPGLEKHTPTPDFSRLWTRLSAPFTRDTPPNLARGPPTTCGGAARASRPGRANASAKTRTGSKQKRNSTSPPDVLPIRAWQRPRQPPGAAGATRWGCAPSASPPPASRPATSSPPTARKPPACSRSSRPAARSRATTRSKPSGGWVRSRCATSAATACGSSARSARSAATCSTIGGSRPTAGAASRANAADGPTPPLPARSFSTACTSLSRASAARRTSSACSCRATSCPNARPRSTRGWARTFAAASPTWSSPISTASPPRRTPFLRRTARARPRRRSPCCAPR